MTKFLEQCAKYLGMFWSFVILFIVASVLEGLVLSYLWQWFVVPLGLKPVTIIHAIGLCVLLDFVTYHYYDYKRSDEAGLATSIAYILIRPTVAIILGAFLHFVC